ncbi:MAG: RnfABCDGE type electron transport complex subunit B [Clostridia bacterium]|nr:RnfABCDGE type electron transport complex subunit B [Clostridia bacterium]
MSINWLQVVFALLALGALGAVFGFVLDVAEKKFAVEQDERVAQVRAACAGANCGACGYPGCDGFAEAVVKGEAPVNGCSAGGAKTAQAIAEIMGGDAGVTEPKVARVICQGECGVAKERYNYDGYHSCQMAAQMVGGPKMCSYSCVGLGDCADVCKFDAIRIENGIAVIDPDRCTACGMCEKTCPRHAIRLMPRDASVIVRCQNSDTGRIAREACMKACIACKRCEKTCQYDAIHVENGFAKIDTDKCTRCGECAKNCPCSCITVEGAASEVA